MNNKKRDVNIDLLKILVMLMVMSLHYLSHQRFLTQYQLGSSMYFLSWFLYGVCVVSVDVFALITGYYLCGKTFSAKKLLDRIFEVLLSAQFCSVLIGCLCIFFFGEEISVGNLLYSFFPTLTNTNWFITAYVLLLIISPMLDRLATKISESVYKRTLILMFLFISVFPSISLQYRVMTKIESGVIVLFAFLYLLGGYIRMYGCNIGRLQAFFVYTCSTILLVFSKFVIDYIIKKVPAIANKLGPDLIGKYGDKFYEYSSFLVVIGAFALFMVFAKMKIEGNGLICKIIRFMAMSTLTVYVCHDQYIIRQEILWNRIVNTDKFVKGNMQIVKLPIMMLLTVIIMYVIFSVAHNLIVTPLITILIRTKIVKNIKKHILCSRIYTTYIKFVTGQLKGSEGDI